MKTLEAGLTALPGAFREATRGALTVELALLAPVLAALLVGAIDFGSYIHQKMQLQNASRAGAQFAIQRDGNASDSAGIENAVRAASDLDAGTGAVVSATFCGCADGSESVVKATEGCDGTCSGGEFPALSIRVTVSNTFAPLFDYPGLPNPLPLQGQTSLQVP